MFRPRHAPLRIVRLAVFLAAIALLVGLIGAQTRAFALDPGTNAVVRADGDCLRLRAQPSSQGAILYCIPDGTVVSVLEGNVTVDGVRWQRIQTGGLAGWSAEHYLAPAPATPGQPTAVPTGVATQPPASTPIPSPELTATLPTGGGFSLGVWGGGPIDRIPPITASRGCTLRAIWIPQGLDFIGYFYGAPGVVNERWNSTYGASLSPGQPLILVCAAPGGPTPAPTSTPVPSGPVPTPGLPPGVPTLPPGPAGNG